VYVNARGFITLVETKLWRNPEARRNVVAQIVEYASAMTGWSYEQFSTVVRKSRDGGTELDLERLFADDPGDFDEDDFIDSVSRNLRRGRFLLLIVGDAIREGVENMIKFLQDRPALGFTLGLVELALFRDGDDGIYIQPRIHARTREIVRAVVEVKPSIALSDVVVSVPTAQEAASPRRRIAEEVFFEHLETLCSRADLPTVQQFVREVLAEARTHRLEPDWTTAGVQFKYTHDDTEHEFNFGKFSRNGGFGQVFRLKNRGEELGLPQDIWRDYFKSLAELMSETERDRQRLVEWLETSTKSNAPRFALLAGHKDEWFAAIDRAIQRIDESLAAK
jgi:hypothetical protein